MVKFDAIVVGSGSAGNPLARKLAMAGKKVALVERALPGGTCTNYGCTPTKTMIASAKAAYQAGRSQEYGVHTSSVSVSLPEVVKRKNSIVMEARAGTEKSLKIRGLSLIWGEASFCGKKEMLIKNNEGPDQHITAPLIFLDTGSGPAIPKISGLQEVPYLNSTSLLELEEIPEHLLIIGGSYIALEFGQMFRRFGSKVSILTKDERFLSQEDEDVASELRTILEAEGMTIITGARVEKVAKAGKDNLEIQYSVARVSGTVAGTHLLMATGRKANTEELRLNQTGVKANEKGYITVNDKLETSVPGIYALGDVKGGPAFTHVAYNDYLVVRENLLEGGKASIKNRQVPYIMYTDPQLGRIGLTETQAQEQNIPYKVAKLPMESCARAIETGETKGFMKVLVTPRSKQILGVAMLGAEGGEIMSLLQIAMEQKIPYPALRNTMFAHPAYAESLINLFLKLEEE